MVAGETDPEARTPEACAPCSVWSSQAPAMMTATKALAARMAQDMAARIAQDMAAEATKVRAKRVRAQKVPQLQSALLLALAAAAHPAGNELTTCPSNPTASSKHLPCTGRSSAFMEAAAPALALRAVCPTSSPQQAQAMSLSF